LPAWSIPKLETLSIVPAVGVKSALRSRNWLLGMVWPSETRATGIDQRLRIAKSAKK
jgi:hypothetical protein